MRTYPGSTNWPEDLNEAHVFLIRVFQYLRQTEVERFARLEAQQIVNKAQIAVVSELYPDSFKEVA